MPKTVKEALALDRRNGNTLWADAIAKEMKEVCIAYNILPDGHSVPIGYQKIPLCEYKVSFVGEKDMN